MFVDRPDGRSSDPTTRSGRECAPDDGSGTGISKRTIVWYNLIASFTLVGKGDKNPLVSFFKLFEGFPSFYRFTRSKSRPIPSNIATLLTCHRAATF
jgi:hypothetical protein